MTGLDKAIAEARVSRDAINKALDEKPRPRSWLWVPLVLGILGGAALVVLS